MNRTDFEKRVRRINPRFSVKLRRGRFVLMDLDRNRKPYVAMSIDGRQPDGRDVRKVYFGEKVRREGTFIKELEKVKESNESKDEELRRMRTYEAYEKSKDFRKLLVKMADEQGAPVGHKPTSAEEGWNNRTAF